MARSGRYRWQNERKALARAAKTGGTTEHLNGKKRPGTKRPLKKPTEKQLAYIRFIAARLNCRVPNVTTRRAASDWIDKMKPRLDGRDSRT